MLYTAEVPLLSDVVASEANELLSDVVATEATELYDQGNMYAAMPCYLKVTLTPPGCSPEFSNKMGQYSWGVL